MIEGFCIPCGADVPVTEQRRCVEHGDLAIPPTWASATIAYPWPARPEGYVYSPPAYLREYQKRLTDSIGKHRKPAPKRTKSVSAALDKILMPPKPPERIGETLIRFVCGICRVAVTMERHHGGRHRRFCSDACRKAASRLRKKGAA